MYYVPSATMLAVGTRFISTKIQYFSNNFCPVESNRIYFSQCTNIAQLCAKSGSNIRHSYRI